MSNHTINTTTARNMVEASALRDASIIGMPGGWSVMLKIGMTEKPLGTQRTDKPRMWRSLDSCVQYLKNELHIARFTMLDASNYSVNDITRRKRTDAAERMKHAHAAADYDKWFRAQVQESIDDPRPSIPHEEVKAEFAAKRATLRKRMSKKA